MLLAMTTTADAGGRRTFTENATVSSTAAVLGGLTTVMVGDVEGDCEPDALADGPGLADVDELDEFEGFTLVELDPLGLTDELPLPLGLGLGVRVVGCDQPP